MRRLKVFLEGFFSSFTHSRNSNYPHFHLLCIIMPSIGQFALSQTLHDIATFWSLDSEMESDFTVLVPAIFSALTLFEARLVDFVAFCYHLHCSCFKRIAWSCLQPIDNLVWSRDLSSAWHDSFLATSPQVVGPEVRRYFSWPPTQLWKSKASGWRMICKFCALNAHVFCADWIIRLY